MEGLIIYPSYFTNPSRRSEDPIHDPRCLLNDLLRPFTRRARRCHMCVQAATIPRSCADFSIILIFSFNLEVGLFDRRLALLGRCRRQGSLLVARLLRFVLDTLLGRRGALLGLGRGRRARWWISCRVLGQHKLEYHDCCRLTRVGEQLLLDGAPGVARSLFGVEATHLGELLHIDLRTAWSVGFRLHYKVDKPLVVQPSGSARQPSGLSLPSR